MVVLSPKELARPVFQGPDPLSDSVAQSDQLLWELSGSGPMKSRIVHEFPPSRTTEPVSGSGPSRETSAARMVFVS